MASVGGVSSSNMTSSLYNSANVISGLASGLDTEGMIEGLVQGYQTKIQKLQNQVTKTEWKQEAYRSIIAKMYSFASKYTSYTSTTNLMSASFFNNAIKVASLGANASKISASGRTESDIRINSVKQLATSARYSTTSNLKGTDEAENFAIKAEKAVKFSDEFDTGVLSGSLVLTYGSQTVSVVFDPNTDIIADKVYKTNDDGSYVLDENGKRVVERERTSAEKAQDLKDLIVKKLGDTTITLSTGQTRDAADLIDVQLSGNQITFKDKSTGGNSVYISDADSSVEYALGLDLDDADEEKPNTIQLSGSTKLTNTKDVGSYISGASMNVSLDGKTKTIKLPEIRKTDDGAYEIKNENGWYEALTGKNYAEAVQKALNKEFGAGKITVTNAGGDDELQLKIEAQANSDLIINTDAGKALGIGNIATNYLNSSKTLGELMDDSAWSGFSPARAVGSTYEKDGKRYDQAGNLVNENGNIVDKQGNELYAFEVNGATVGYYNKNSKLSDIMSDLNNNTEAGVKVSYSQTTRKFTFTTKETGSENGIAFGGGLATAMFGTSGSAGSKFAANYGLDLADGETQTVTFEVPGSRVSFNVTKDSSMEDVARELNDSLSFFGYTASYNKTSGQLLITDKTGKMVDFKATADGEELEAEYESNYTPGQDAVLAVEINGDRMEMTRGSNNFSLDGMTVNLKGTFNEEAWSKNGFDWKADTNTEAVTFQRTTDSDKIVDVIKDMITDFNAMLSEIRGQYATLPYQNSSGAFQTYEPLTDEDKATMSESAIQAYEEKAKQGLLFNDQNLSSLYSNLLGIFTDGGKNQQQLSQMGISITYSSVDGSAQLTLDENKLRNVLDTDPDMVMNVFTRSSASDGQSLGIMQQMKTQLDRYGALTGSVKGILVEQAGTPLSSLSLMNNYWQKQIDSINNEITKWQDKLSAQVDKYTSMFSKLETLIYQMNSQSSTLAGLMGGSGY